MSSEEQIREEEQISKRVDKVTSHEFLEHLKTISGSDNCPVCNNGRLGVVKFADTDNCSVMAAPFSQYDPKKTHFESYLHGTPFFMAVCESCGHISLYHAYSLAKLLLKKDKTA